MSTNGDRYVVNCASLVEAKDELEIFVNAAGITLPRRSGDKLSFG